MCGASWNAAEREARAAWRVRRPRGASCDEMCGRAGSQGAESISPPRARRSHSKSHLAPGAQERAGAAVSGAAAGALARGRSARGTMGGAVSLCARRCLCCGVLCVLLRTVGVSCDGYSKGRFIVLSFVVARRMVGGGMLEHSHLLSAGARAVSLTTPFAALRGFFSIARRVH